MSKNFLALCLCFGILASCSTIVTRTSQPVNVSTNLSTEASCTLTDSKGSIYKVTTPGSVIVKKGDGPLQVSCSYKDKAGSKVVSETIEPWFFGNLLIGGIIGVAVDAVSGAYQKYPDDIMVTLINN